ncbi:MAG: hypothetical protein ACFBSC_12280 [Microcoleaceae cyanobacterium]
MVNSTASDRERLEKLWLQSPASNQFDGLRSKVRQILEHCLTWLTAGDRLRVWPTSKVEGVQLWAAHDPLTGDSVADLCETDLRRWIENR